MTGQVGVYSVGGVNSFRWRQSGRAAERQSGRVAERQKPSAGFHPGSELRAHEFASPCHSGWRPTLGNRKETRSPKTRNPTRPEKGEAREKVGKGGRACAEEHMRIVMLGEKEDACRTP